MAECPSIAYAVPAPTSMSTADLQALYAAQVSPNFQSFNLSMSTFPCGIRNQGTYSFVRTCDDCLQSYRDWNCATNVPRCDDVPVTSLAGATSIALAQSQRPLLSSNQTVYSVNPVPSDFLTDLVRANSTISRTPWLSPQALANYTSSNTSVASVIAGQSPFPYAEVPPCGSLCYLVPASCPPFIGWNCPLPGITLQAGYGALRILPDSSTDGGDAGQIANGGGSGHGIGRAQDRYGNVFCSALGSDVLLAKRTGSANLSKTLSIGLLCLSLYLTTMFTI